MLNPNQIFFNFITYSLNTTQYLKIYSVSGRHLWKIRKDTRKESFTGKLSQRGGKERGLLASIFTQQIPRRPLEGSKTNFYGVVFRGGSDKRLRIKKEGRKEGRKEEYWEREKEITEEKEIKEEFLLSWRSREVQRKDELVYGTNFHSNHVQSDDEDIACASESLFYLPLHMSTILYLLILENLTLYEYSYDQWLGR